MNERRGLWASLWCLLFVAGCTPEPPPSTGGTDIEPGPFGRGVVTVNIGDDYDAANTSLVGMDGRVLSQSFIAAGLSGDSAAPSAASAGQDVVLLDRRYSLITWVDVKTGKIREQFHADGDELARNPWDYLAVNDHKAIVTRYDGWPGNSAHGDLLIVDPSTASVTAPVERRLDIAASLALPEEHVAHPARGFIVGERAFVTVVVATIDYAEYGDSVLLVLDPETDDLLEARPLSGLSDCTGVAVSPSQTTLAVVCSGDIHADAPDDPARSGVVLLDLPTLSEKQRFAASALGPGPLGFSLSFASDNLLVVTGFGDGASNNDDYATVIDLNTGVSDIIHRTGAVQLGAVLCPQRLDGQEGSDATPPACFITDAEAGELLRFPLVGGALSSPERILVDADVVGLPPRYLGQF